RDKPCGGVHQSIAAEDRPGSFAETDPYHSRRGLPLGSNGMMKAQSLRFRMMLLFCSVVGVLLAGSYLAFWGLLAHAVHTQLNRQLLETARPIISDMMAEPDAQDINRLDLPGEFFELLDPTGRVLQQSKNLVAPINL